jgi:hypothetical protein
MSEQPYKPSWVDRLTTSIDKLPAPPWLVYLAVAVPWIAIFIAVQDWQGAYRAEGFNGWHIFVAAQPIFGMAMMHYSDWFSANAFWKFQPAMKGGESELDAALYRLTTMPSRPASIASLLGGLFAVAQLVSIPDAESLAAFQQVAPTPVSLVIHDVNIILVWVGYGAWIYQALQKLRTIDWLVASKAVIDPYHPEPLYALSGITSRMALIVMPPLYGWYLVMTGGTWSALPSTLSVILIYTLSLILGLFVFIWPLWGAHQLLTEAKIKSLDDNATHYKIAVQELHRSVSVKALDQIEVWHEALDALDIERRLLVRLPTWPWPPGTFRNLLVTMVIPILVWLVQFGLQRLME